MSFLEVNAHKRIAALCEELANEVYETCAISNKWYKLHPDRNAFIRQCAPTLKLEARGIMAKLLTDDSVPQTEKELIYEALCLDSALPPTGTWSLPAGHA
jgi:hypothetical protein